MDTKDPVYDIPKELTFNTEIRKFQNDDLLNADNVINPVMQKIVENTAYSKGKVEECETQLGTKVTKVSGKGLSTNDYTTADKNKLSELRNLITNNTNALNHKVDKSYGIRANTFFGNGIGRNEKGFGNTAFGFNALHSGMDYKITGFAGCNTTIGTYSSYSLVEGNSNTVLGAYALEKCTKGFDTIAIGNYALNQLQNGNPLTEANGCIGIGTRSTVSGDYQIQLGSSNQTTYAYGSIQNRSDRRDKADIQNTQLGLEFISKLRPVEFKWDYRDDYFEEVEKEDGTTELKKIPKDGSKKRKRPHQGFIAQEVKQVMDNLNVDFGGYQDHSVNGGCDVLSLGYEEFIAPMVKAIQEQHKMILELQEQIKLLGGKK